MAVGRPGHAPPGAELERVFRAEYGRVVAVARRVLGSDPAAEDVAQEVFVEYARSGVPPDQARGWLVVAATHQALNTIRSGRRRDDREVRAGIDPSLNPGAAPDVADDVLRDDDRRRVRDALAALPTRSATVLVMRHSGLSYAEIAEALDLAPGGIGTILRRAEAALREELTRDGTRS